MASFHSSWLGLFIYMLVAGFQSSYGQNISQDSSRISFAVANMHKGDSLRRLMQLDQAFEQYQRAEQALEGSQLWNEVILARSHRCRILFQQEKFVEAESLIQSSLSVSHQKLGDKNRNTASLYNLAAAIEGKWHSDLLASLNYLQQALNSIEGLADEASLMVKAETLGSIGMVQQSLSAFDKALPYTEASMDIIRKLKGDNSLYLAFGYQDMASNMSQQGRYEDALNYYHKNQNILNSVLPDHHDFISNTYVDIGRTLDHLGRYSEALEYYAAAQNSFKTHHGIDNIHVAEVLHAIGKLLTEQEAFDEAQLALHSASQIMINALPSGHVDLADIAISQGDFYFKNGKYSEAKEYISQALKTYVIKFDSAHFKVIDALTRLGEIAFSKKEFNHAHSVLNRARQLHQSQFTDFGPQLSRIYFLRAQIYFEQHLYDLALLSTNQSLIALRDSATYESYLDHRQLVDIYQLRVIIYEQLYSNALDSNLLIKALEQSLICLEQMDYITNMQSSKATVFWLNKMFPMFENSIRLAYQLYKITDKNHFLELALNVSERSKSSMLKSHLNGQRALQYSGIDSTLLSELRMYHDQIVALENRMLESGTKTNEHKFENQISANLNSALFQINQRHDSLLRAIEKLHPKFYQLKYAKNSVNLEQLINDRPERLMIEYFFGLNHIYIFGLNRELCTFSQIPLTDSLSQLITHVQRQLSGFGRDVAAIPASIKNYAHSTHSLYQKLVSPALSGTSNINSILIIPDGLLCYLSFDALTTQPDSLKSFRNLPYLIQAYDISYRYSLSPLNSVRRHASLPYLGLAPQYNSSSTSSNRVSLHALEHNKDEIQAGQKLFGGKVLVGEQATYDNFRVFAPHARVLHLAMHAILDDPNPMKSRLAFQLCDTGHCALYLHELFNMELNADLVVLSACHSGAGQYRRGEGVLSLSRGFNYAGSGNIAMSLWEFSDVVGAELVILFFNHLVNVPDPSKALKQAKLDFIQSADPIVSHPHYWAGMVYSGDSGSIHFENKRALNPFWLIAGTLILFALLWRWQVT
jgi:CHAT domain-containing protein